MLKLKPMIFSVAWRNVWRNKTRSLVVIIAVVVGLFGGTFSVGVMNGAVEQRISSAIHTECSHIQLHNPKYLDNNELVYTIDDPGLVVSRIEALENVKAVSSRAKIIAMASTAETGTGVMIYGIDPEREREVTDLGRQLIDGTYFGDDKKNTIVIGHKLAEKLGAGIRSKIVLTFQSADGSITGGAFRVKGIYKTTNSAFDEMNVFIRQSDLARTGEFDPAMTHEIAVLLDNTEATAAVTGGIAALCPSLLVQDWKTILPDVGMISDWMDQMMFIFVGIILLALAFGIVNTMLMVVLERVKELGMLMAVGMSKARVFMMITLETIFLSLTGGITGMVISEVVVSMFSKRGLDFSMFSDGFEAIGYPTLIFPKVSPSYYIILTLLVIITAIGASIYPALKALKLDPADALRTE